ncbi:aldehyde dehydrogenase (NADP(+)) [Streptomyces arenae]|uniref:aldehyde dehydrogenase (NADP(+)) n=1 Tax=Streptomyces arenae TaxID=29301 RepID=UPI00265A4826|nr:aldehyde dehydrogenase (NADP(+)) [Streptomyces arenae]MCG7207457.1 aldehyde dehydrogenase (NADP(+)) [Streptomyces arenae]
MPSPVSSVDPRTGALTEAVVMESTAADVNGAVESAVRAAAGLEALGSHGRAALLDTLAEALENQREALVDVADRETALGAARLNGELARTTYQLRFIADVLRDGRYTGAVIDHAQDTAMGPQPDLRRMLIPLGPVAVFAASNFPFAFSMPGGDVASALAAGCPVIVKAHPSHPATSEAVFSILSRAAAAADAPAGLLTRVHGMVAGQQLVAHPDVKAVAFTGSTRGGRALFDLATGRSEPIPFFGELGSLNPLAVTPAAAAERAAQIGEAWVESFTLGVGQFCTKPGLALVPAGADGDALRDAAVKKTRAVAPAWMLNQGIHDAYQSGVAHLVHVPGAIAHVAGDVRGTEGFAAGAALIEVSTADLAAHTAPLLDECFGPVGIIARYASEDDLLETLRRLDGSLTATVHLAQDETTLPRHLIRIAAERAGRIVVNGFPTGVAVNWAQHHGGPWPSSTNSQHTSVGALSVQRFLRPVAYQNVPDAFLPPELQDANPLELPRRVDGEY